MTWAVSANGCKGLLASLCIPKDYAKAKTTLLDVITNSGKSIMPYGKYRDAFHRTYNPMNQ